MYAVHSFCWNEEREKFVPLGIKKRALGIQTQPKNAALKPVISKIDCGGSACQDDDVCKCHALAAAGPRLSRQRQLFLLTYPMCLLSFCLTRLAGHKVASMF